MVRENTVRVSQEHFLAKSDKKIRLTMSYSITCDCGKVTWANNIVELIRNHTNEIGHIICTECSFPRAHIFQESRVQEKGKPWRRYIKGVIPIRTAYEVYTPYIFLSSETKTGEIDHIQFYYYKDTRKDGGRLKHGHGPGGTPAFNKKELFQLLEKLINYGCLTKKEIKDFFI